MLLRWTTILSMMILGCSVGMSEDKKPTKAEDKKPAQAEEKDNEDKPIRALVFFRTAPKKLNEEELTAIFKKQFPEGEAKVIATTEINAIVILLKPKITLLINSFPKPYYEDTKSVADQIEEKLADKSLSQAVRKHQAWLSVDVLGDDLTEKNQKEHYEILAKVIAELHDKQSTVLYFTEFNRFTEANKAALTALKTGKAIDLANDGIILISNSDEELKKAEQKARDTWPDFIKAWENKVGQGHAVKIHFKQGKNSEHMWVAVDKIEGDTITGRLANVPNKLTNVKEGDVVKRSVKEIEDWIYVEKEKLVGGYSIEVLKNAQKNRQKQ